MIKFKIENLKFTVKKDFGISPDDEDYIKALNFYADHYIFPFHSGPTMKVQKDTFLEFHNRNRTKIFTEDPYLFLNSIKIQYWLPTNFREASLVMTNEDFENYFIT